MNLDKVYFFLFFTQGSKYPCIYIRQYEPYLYFIGGDIGW